MKQRKPRGYPYLHEDGLNSLRVIGNPVAFRPFGPDTDKLIYSVVGILRMGFPKDASSAIQKAGVFLYARNWTLCEVTD